MQTSYTWFIVGGNTNTLPVINAARLLTVAASELHTWLALIRSKLFIPEKKFAQSCSPQL